jgi:hypothetical protein
MSRFNDTPNTHLQPHPQQGHNHLAQTVSGPDAEKYNQTHMEYTHGEGDGDNVAHTPKELDQPLGGYLHKDSAFERKVLRKIDLRLVPVLCAYTLREGASGSC